MKLEELEARKIVIDIMGQRGELKSDPELAEILKKRLTKKERKVLNAKFTGEDIDTLMATLNIDKERLEKIVAGAVKKIKNETLHKEFYR